MKQKFNSTKNLQTAIGREPKSWLITGAAGFIGSNLIEELLQLGQVVVGLDNFSTGYARNIEEVSGPNLDKGRFRFIEGDIRSLDDCRIACDGIDIVLHQAALGSVPRSLEDPITTNAVNVTGLLNMLVAARDAGVDRFVYASSSSVYGDHPDLPKVEGQTGRLLSPYAVTKKVNELYAQTFQDNYGLTSIGLRYFNVFGPRQDPNGSYAAVIPKWIGRLMAGEQCIIYGDGETSRDFCYVANVVQANLLAALAPESATNAVYNIAVGEQTTLNELYAYIHDRLLQVGALNDTINPIYDDFRDGDIRHSLADIHLASEDLGYVPAKHVGEGLNITLDWYLERDSIAV